MTEKTSKTQAQLDELKSHQMQQDMQQAGQQNGVGSTANGEIIQSDVLGPDVNGPLKMNGAAPADMRYQTGGQMGNMPATPASPAVTSSAAEVANGKPILACLADTHLLHSETHGSHLDAVVSCAS